MHNEPGALRVLQVTARYFPYIGGIETHVHEVGRRLAQMGAAVTVLTTDPSGQLPDEEERQGIQIRRVRAWPAHKDYYFAPALYHHITRGGWDVVHCQGYHTLVAPLALIAARHARIPYVVTFHSGGDSSHLRALLRGTQRMALRPLLAGAQRLIGPSRWEVEFYREHLRLPARQFTVIPNGTQPQTVRIDATGQVSGKKLIVSLGRLERYKGHHRVIAALPYISEQIPDVRLRIIGTGSYEAALRKLAQKFGVAECVEIGAIPPGDSKAMAEAVGQADLVTLLSEHEAQGIAVLEALALRRSVLVANSCALQEFATRGLARAIPLESTPREVAAAIVGQLRDPLVPAHVDLPTWDDCAADLLTLYRSLLSSS